MSNDKGLLSGSITILIGAVIAIMALVRGPWQAWLLIGVFTLWGLWVVLILLLPYMQQAKRRRQRQQRERRLHAEGIAQSTFQVPELEEPVSDDLLLRYANHRILAYLRSSYSDACFEWCEKRPAELIRTNGTGRIRLHNVDGFDHADITFGQDATIQCDLLKIVPLSKAGTEQGDEANIPPNKQPIDPRIWYENCGREVMETLIADLNSRGHTASSRCGKTATSASSRTMNWCRRNILRTFPRRSTGPAWWKCLKARACRLKPRRRASRSPGDRHHPERGVKSQ